MPRMTRTTTRTTTRRPTRPAAPPEADDGEVAEQIDGEVVSIGKDQHGEPATIVRSLPRVTVNAWWCPVHDRAMPITGSTDSPDGPVYTSTEPCDVCHRTLDDYRNG